MKLKEELGYLVVVTGISTLRRLIVAISAVSGEEIFTFPF